MPKVTYIEDNGDTIEVEVPVGLTLMRAAIENSVEGIAGDCGGTCACGTCHCFVDEDWWEVVGPPNPEEEDMLSFVEARQDKSRLCCQITMSEEIDGIVVRLPDSQY